MNKIYHHPLHVKFLHLSRMLGIIALLLLLTTQGLPFVRAESDKFGEDMLDFVTDEAGPAARRFMDGDYGARSLNGFGVTLDKARVTANESRAALVSTDRLLASAQAALLVATPPNGGPPTNTLSRTQVAEMAALSTELRSSAEVLAYQSVMIPAAKRSLDSLDSPLTREDFKDSGLSKVPLYFLLTSIGEKREFPTNVSLEMTVSNDGASPGGANATHTGLYFFGLWQSMKDEKDYKQQVRKFKEALELLPTVLPDDGATYDSYVAGFKKAQEIYRPEVTGLKAHLDFVHRVIIDRYDVVDAARAALLNTLLSDRVRASFESLDIQDFRSRPDSARALRDTAFNLSQTRNRVKKLYDIALTSKRMPQVFSSLEDIEETAAAVDTFLQRIDSVAIYQPLRRYLPELRAWFQEQGKWATNELLTGSSKTLANKMIGGSKSLANKSTVKQSLAKNAWKEVHRISRTKVAEKKSQSLSPLKQSSNNFLPEDPIGFSINYNWPGGGSGPHHAAYPEGGGAVWSRGTDGAFARDARNPGEGKIGYIRADLGNRTTRNDVLYATAVTQARQVAARRQEEIEQQAAPLQRTTQMTTAARAAIPGRGEPIRHYTSHRFKSLEIDERHRQMDTGYSVRLSVERARQDLLMTREGVPPSPGSQPNPEIEAKIKEYRRLHGEYLKAAEAFWRAKHPKEAEELFDSAISIRAWLRGYETTSIHLASFNPLRPVQMLVETLGQKFPLERAIGPEHLTSDEPLFTGAHDRIAACNRRTAEVVELIYGYSGFHNPSAAIIREVGPNGHDNGNEDGRPVLNAKGILRYAMNHPEEWQHLGDGTSAETLSQAQRLANLGVAVIAVSMHHVAPLMPGELQPGGRSFGHPVPTIYNSVLNRPEATRSYYYGPLNYAWSVPAEVQFFALWDR